MVGARRAGEHGSVNRGDTRLSQDIGTGGKACPGRQDIIDKKHVTCLQRLRTGEGPNQILPAGFAGQAGLGGRILKASQRIISARDIQQAC